MTPQECHDFLMEEAMFAENIRKFETAEKFKECAEMLASLEACHALHGWF